jgi:hypothetical protein
MGGGGKRETSEGRKERVEDSIRGEGGEKGREGGTV